MRVKSCIICSLSLVNFQARMPLFPNWESNTLQLVQRMHVDWTIKLMSDIRAKSIPFPETLLTTTISHCRYLNIYISQKTRLCAVDLKGKFQTNLQAKSITFFVWKFRFFVLIFLLFFEEFVKSTAFYTLLLIFQRVDISKLWFLHQNAIQACQLFEIAATVCKKQWIWQILQKLEGKWE